MTNVSDIPILKIARILDSKSTVLVGHGLNKINKHDGLIVLSIDKKIPGTKTLLVVPKESLSVETQTNDYIIAKTPIREVQEFSGLSLFASTQTGRTVKRRKDFLVDENEISGNPENAPIKIGDVVIREEDLARFVEALKNLGPEGIDRIISSKQE